VRGRRTFTFALTLPLPVGGDEPRPDIAKFQISSTKSQTISKHQLPDNRTGAGIRVVVDRFILALWAAII